MESNSALQQRAYPIRLRLRYIMDQHRGNGCTVSMSRSAIVFEADDDLPVGKPVRLSINWPAKLQNNIALTLTVEGTTIQARNQHVSVSILRYEFRIRPMLRGVAV